MKRRSGHVSNSSSSSFIIGLGIVKDENLLIKELLGCDEYDYGISTINELEEDAGWGSDAIYNRDKKEVKVTACVNSEPYITINVEDEDRKLFVINVGNNEGDGEFYNGDDWELDYSKVDYEYFSKNQQKLIDILNNQNIIEKGSTYQYGVERNG